MFSLIKKYFFFPSLLFACALTMALAGKTTAAAPVHFYPSKPAGNAGFPQDRAPKPKAENKTKGDKADEKSRKANRLLARGQKLRDEAKFDSAAIYLKKAYQIRKEIGPPEELTNAVRSLSLLYTAQGQTHSSLKLLLNALTEMELNKEVRCQSDICILIAQTYEQIGNYQTSLKYLNRAELHLNDIGQDTAAGLVASNMANSYFLSDSLEQAEFHYLRALKLFKQSNNQKGTTSTLANLGNLQHYMGKTNEGYRNIKDALDLAVAQGQQADQARLLNNLAIIHWESQETGPADKKFKEALAIATKLRNIEIIQDIAGNLYHMNKDRGLYKESLGFLELYGAYHDSLFNETRSQQIAELQEQYEAEKRNREIEILRKNQQLKEAKLVTINWQRNASLAGTFLLGLVAFLIVRSSRQKQKATSLLAAKTDELNRQRIQDLIKEQELVSVHSMLKGQEAERGRIAQDLHDRLGSLLATVKLHVQMANTPEQQQLVNKLIDDACQEVRQIAHNMVSGVLMKFGLVPALQDLANAISLSGQINMETFAYGLDNRLPNHMEIELYRIVQELVSNTLKHAQATEITVQINRQHNMLNLLVEDNGAGFNPQSIVTKAGMGLSGIEARINQLNGELNIDSGKGSGTTIMVDLPLPEIAEYKPKPAPAGAFAYDSNSISR